jgi:SRSO17 transposase
MHPEGALDAGLLDRLEAFIRPVLLGLPKRARRDLGQLYVAGLLGPGERKSVEPIVRRQQGGEALARERRMREMLADDDWNAQSLMVDGAERLLRATDGWEAYTLDDTALLKRGWHSVGVGKQYAGCVGHVTNCQCLVTMGLASNAISTLILTRLFLPQTWFGSKSAKRCEEARVPEAVVRRGYQTKHEIVLGLIEQLRLEGMPKLPFLCDSGYGGSTEFRQALSARDEEYVAGVTLDMSVWDAGVTFELPKRKPGPGRNPLRMVPVGAPKPKSVLSMAKGLPPAAWTEVTWREGSRGPQRSRFAAVRVRAARGYDTTTGTVTEVHPEEWLLVHWPDGEPEPTKAWLSNLPKDTGLLRLVQLARLRWRIERDHQEGKELLGLDHYEGRSWHGLHHHLALVLLAQQFLALERWTEQKKAQLAAPPIEPAAPPPEAFPPSLAVALVLRHRRAPAGAHRPVPVSVLPDVPAAH